MSEAEEEGEDADGYESPDLEGARKKVFCRSTLQGRSPALTQVMHTLDRKTARRTEGVQKALTWWWKGVIQALPVSQAALPLMMPFPSH